MRQSGSDPNMKEYLRIFKTFEFKHPFLQKISGLLRHKSEQGPLGIVDKHTTDPAQSEYPANIYFAPGELDEDYLTEPKRSAILQFAADFGKDIIHLPSKPKGRVLIGVGVAAMVIAGAKVIYDHHSKQPKES
jgi:hypothetical protein